MAVPAEEAECFLFSPNRSWLREVEAKYILMRVLNETHISCC